MTFLATYPKLIPETDFRDVSGDEANLNDSQKYGEGGIRTHEGVTYDFESCAINRTLPPLHTP